MARRILLIVDDPNVRQSLTTRLESEGWEVRQASDRSTALETLRTQPQPDLILLDLSGMDGWHFRVEQRSDERLASIPTVVASENSNVEHWAAIMGAAGYLNKPIQSQALVQAAWKVYGRGRQVQ